MFKKIKYYKTFVNDLEKRINENQITEIKEYQLAIRNFISRGYYRVYLECRDKFFTHIDTQNLSSDKSSHSIILDRLKKKGQYEASDRLLKLSTLRKFADYDYLNTTIVELSHGKTLEIISKIKLDIEWEENKQRYKAVNIKLFVQYMDDVLLALSKI